MCQHTQTQVALRCVYMSVYDWYQILLVFRHNAITSFAYYNKGPSAVVRFRRPPQSERLEYLDNALTEIHQILHGHPHQPTIKYTLTTSGGKLSRKTSRKFGLQQ